MRGTTQDAGDGLELRELRTIAEFEAADRLFAGIWKTGAEGTIVSVEMMRALSHAGNYLVGAYARGRLAGASVGFFAAPVGTVLHSHITGAVPGAGAGLALKRHQRAWALARGLTMITWTYDPLVRRNAHFNLVKLGARPEEYYESFYGAMDDQINGGDESDRVLTVWRLDSAEAVAAAEGRPVTVAPPEGAAHGLRE
ncbi:GNAT family N-acetyltransferase, partial [Actinocorallia lasiicapitis]